MHAKAASLVLGEANGKKPVKFLSLSLSLFLSGSTVKTRVDEIVEDIELQVLKN